jgi:hypothetical protein
MKLAIKESNQKTFDMGLTSGLTLQTKLLIFVALLIVLVSAGVLVAMYATATETPSQNSSTNQSEASSTNVLGTVSSDSLSGYQIGYAPQGIWTRYIGFIPQGYKIAPREPDAPVFPCPTGMSSVQCQQFQQTCGNGVCDPNERCDTCPIDCSVSGALVCDPYTGRTGSPASVCQISQQQQQAQLPG